MIMPKKNAPLIFARSAMIGWCALVIQSCMPPQPYRPAPQTQASRSSTANTPSSTPPSAAPAETPKPLPQEAKIREQDLKKGSTPAPPPLRDTSKETRGAEVRSVPDLSAPPLRDDSSLLAKITAGT